jgi:hypothetical protein
MSIQRDLDELNSLNIEINRLYQTIRDYRKQKKIIEDRIINFLKHQESQGVRYQDQAVLLESKDVRSKKKKSEKIDDIATVLQKYGIQKSEKLLNDILEAQRGQTNKNDILKVVKRQ